MHFPSAHAPKIRLQAALTAKDKQLVLFAFAAGKTFALGKAGTALDKKSGRAITSALRKSGFSGGSSEQATLLAPARTSLQKLIVLGMGEGAALRPQDWHNAGARAAVQAQTHKFSALTILADVPDKSALAPDAAAAYLADGVQLRAYHFDRHKTRKTDKATLTQITVTCSDLSSARDACADLAAASQGTLWARDLVNEAPNVLVPDIFAKACSALRIPGLKVTVLDEKKIRAEGLGALLGVAQGSINPPRLVVLEWQGGKKGEAPLAFIGKGVTFDTGGISLKPAASMIEFNMKCDMAGAAAVAGLMAALATRKARVNAVGILGLVENMISATAMRPGDVIAAGDGQTIEVLNTDAEGRLVLADCLHYVQTHHKPRLMVNLATLTGAIVATLGHDYAGLFSNNDALAAQLAQSGAATQEPLWRLPMGACYDKLLKSDIADMKNIGGAKAGSITAAQFLHRFVMNKTAWAHLDIAGTAWLPGDTTLSPRGGSGFGVRLLDHFVAKNYEA